MRKNLICGIFSLYILWSFLSPLADFSTLSAENGANLWVWKCKTEEITIFHGVRNGVYKNFSFCCCTIYCYPEQTRRFLSRRVKMFIFSLRQQLDVVTVFSGVWVKFVIRVNGQIRDTWNRPQTKCQMWTLTRMKTEKYSDKENPITLQQRKKFETWLWFLIPQLNKVSSFTLAWEWERKNVDETRLTWMTKRDFSTIHKEWQSKKKCLFNFKFHAFDESLTSSSPCAPRQCRHRSFSSSTNINLHFNSNYLGLGYPNVIRAVCMYIFLKGNQILEKARLWTMNDELEREIFSRVAIFSSFFMSCTILHTLLSS